MNVPTILVCGGRGFRNFDWMNDVLNSICHDRGWISDKSGNELPSVRVISGGASGADSLAIRWASENWCLYDIFPAMWNVYGRRAGHIRNQWMLDEGKPDLVVAFPGGTGTADMMRRARAEGVEVVEVKYKETCCE